jgi:hypothetical protein
MKYNQNNILTLRLHRDVTDCLKVVAKQISNDERRNVSVSEVVRRAIMKEYICQAMGEKE